MKKQKRGRPPLGNGPTKRFTVSATEDEYDKLVNENEKGSQKAIGRSCVKYAVAYKRLILEPNLIELAQKSGLSKDELLQALLEYAQEKQLKFKKKFVVQP